jgi:hypothetical protein
MEGTTAYLAKSSIVNCFDVNTAMDVEDFLDERRDSLGISMNKT